MFFNILDEPRQVLLKKLTADLPVADSYLAGGTALALMIGHRQSIDFDWFSPANFDPAALARRLGNIGDVRIAETSSGTFHGWVDGIQVTWLRYPNPVLDSLVSIENLPGFKMASMLDIAVMKWAAISDRGSRKDFIDLFAICKKGISMENLVPLISQKYPNANINYYHMIKSLVYFDDAEKEGFPVMIKPINWSEVKQFFCKEHKKLLNDFLDKD
jgi:hypothetical protein